jgi:hypothetical protein
LEKRGQGREVKKNTTPTSFENSKIEMQELKLENELTKSKTKLENATLKSDIRKIESDT